MVVDSPEPNYYNPANHEQILMLDDVLIDDEGLLPYGKDVGNYAIMGRFGNLFLVNGEPDYRLEVKKGDVDRKSTRLNSSHGYIYTLSLHDALPISWWWTRPSLTITTRPTTSRS